MVETIIKIKNLCLDIGEKKILRGISFEAGKGKRISIIGANGAGKTTLLRCMDRIISGYRGLIMVKGRDLRKYHQKALARILAYVPQSTGFSAAFTVREFIMMARFPHLSSFSIVRAEDVQIVSETMALTGTAALETRPLTTLSGGELQRVNIAAAVAQQSDVMLLDEPTTFLDYRHQDQIHNLLEKINASKATTMIRVTHDINSAVMFSDRVIALRAGKVVFNGLPEQVMDNSILEEVYQKKFLFTEHPRTGQKLIIPF